MVGYLLGWKQQDYESANWFTDSALVCCGSGPFLKCIKVELRKSNAHYCNRDLLVNLCIDSKRID